MSGDTITQFVSYLDSSFEIYGQWYQMMEGIAWFEERIS